MVPAIAAIIGLSAGFLVFKPGSPRPEVTPTVESVHPILDVTAKASPLIVEPPAKDAKMSELERALELAAEEAREDRADLIDEVMDLEAKNAGLEKKLNELIVWMLQNYKGKYPVAEGSMDFMDMPAVNSNLLLGTELVDFLRIGDEERAAIDQAFLDTAKVLTDVQASVMKTTQPTINKLVLHIPPHPEEGEITRSDLYERLRNTLGKPRFERLLQVSEKQLEKSFGYFGERSRTIVFEMMDQTGDAAGPLLRIRDGWTGYDENDRKIIDAVELVVTELPREYRTYIEWVPQTHN